MAAFFSGKGLTDFAKDVTGTSIITGDTSFGSSVQDFIPGVGDYNAQKEANKQNLQESQANRDFQERMSSTAYQRAMADMKTAGLNPTLAYMQGGASSPSGSTASVQPASKTGLADFALKATTGLSGVAQNQTAIEQQKTMNESAIQLNATTAAKNVADAQRIRTETRGLGKKEGEGQLWHRFYKGINSILDSSSKDAARRNKTEAPLIKKIGPASKSQSNSMFNFLNKKGPQ